MQTNYQDPVVVVVGGAGYIGSVLVRHLLSANYSVRVFDNYLFGNAGLSGLTDPRLNIVEGDICDTRAVSNAIRGAETVILLAAVVGRRMEDVRKMNIRDVNFLASTVVLDAAIEHGASRFIFASTDSVYGTQSGVMYETSVPEPVSQYSRLKLRMEERVMSEKKRTFHPTALRIATCYGYSQRMRFDLVANGLIRDAVCKKEIIVQSGEQCRSLVHVEDVARATLAVLRAHINLVSGEVFNVGSNDQTLTLNQLANIVRATVPESSVEIKSGDPDLVNYHLSCTKIQKILDFSPTWTVEKSMERLKGLISQGTFPDPYSLVYHNT